MCFWYQTSLIHFIAVSRKEKLPIDKQNPVVVKLRNLGYELEECLEAAKLHPEDAVAAQNYLTRKKQKQDLFMLGLVESVDKHNAVSVSVEKPASAQQKVCSLEFFEERCVNDSIACLKIIQFYS